MWRALISCTSLLSRPGIACPPSQFFGSAVAALLALRGSVPLHGSAVEVDGRAILICGDGGDGKSTLAAALVAEVPGSSPTTSAPCASRQDGTPVLAPGRRSIRLHPRAIEMIEPIAADESCVRRQEASRDAAAGC